MPDATTTITPSNFETLLAQYVEENPTLCMTMSDDDIARVTATSLNLEGFDVTAEDLRERYGSSRSR